MFDFKRINNFLIIAEKMMPDLESYVKRAINLLDKCEEHLSALVNRGGVALPSANIDEFRQPLQAWNAKTTIISHKTSEAVFNIGAIAQKNMNLIEVLNLSAATATFFLRHDVAKQDENKVIGPFVLPGGASRQFYSKADDLVICSYDGSEVWVEVTVS